MRLSGVSPEVQLHVAGVIESAANEVLTRGWHQGAFHREGSSSVCTATAIMIAAGLVSTPRGADVGFMSMEEYEAVQGDLAIVAFAQYLGNTGGSKTATIWLWNDTEARTEDEVLTALMSCAESLRSGIRVAA